MLTGTTLKRWISTQKTLWNEGKRDEMGGGGSEGRGVIKRKPNDKQDERLNKIQSLRHNHITIVHNTELNKMVYRRRVKTLR